MAEPEELAPNPSAQTDLDTEALNSGRVTLADLSAKGTAEYSQKNYEKAAEYYADAAALQAELHGEMDPQNAEILYLYGRALFRVGQQKSDILGDRASGEKKANGSAMKQKSTTGDDARPEESEDGVEVKPKDEEDVAKAVIEASGGSANGKSAEIKKPLFQFTGDENFEDSDEEVEEDGDGEEEDDDLALSFEILDLARVLFIGALSSSDNLEDSTEGKGKAAGDSPATRHIKERLAETHCLLAEISLENEKYEAAVDDFRSALANKQELYPEESEDIAQAHYFLSLALEMASIKRDSNGELDEGDSKAIVDQELRDEAVREQEAAIRSTKLKLQNKEVQLASSSSPDDNDITRALIIDVKEIIAEMEDRLKTLRGPPVNFKEVMDEQFNQQSKVVSGFLAAAIGESTADTAARVEKATATATDLTGLVRHNKKSSAPQTEPNENGKRKAEDEAEGDGKKTKVETIS